MGACHYRDYDFMNLSGQLNIMCEYVGWHIGNSEVDFVVPIINRSWARADNFSKILQNSQTFARSARWGQQSLSAHTILQWSQLTKENEDQETFVFNPQNNLSQTHGCTFPHD